MFIIRCAYVKNFVRPSLRAGHRGHSQRHFGRSHAMMWAETFRLKRSPAHSAVMLLLAEDG